MAITKSRSSGAEPGSRRKVLTRVGVGGVTGMRGVGVRVSESKKYKDGTREGR